MSLLANFAKKLKKCLVFLILIKSKILSTFIDLKSKVRVYYKICPQFRLLKCHIVSHAKTETLKRLFNRLKLSIIYA